LNNLERFIYFLGTSNRSIEEFLEILKIYSINLVVDVRRFPTSKFEHFKKENLEPLLLKENIKYLYLGKELGGYRSQGYESYTYTQEFKKAIEVLKELSKENTLCIICAERIPFRCHRRFIAQALAKDKELKVLHILEKDRTLLCNPYI
jgi:uncharacterized protein (DUF488 family)